MRAYNARIRAIPAVLDTAIAQSRLSDAAGVHAPKFAVERVISGSQKLISGAPFDGGADLPLWADAKAKVGKLQAGGKINSADAAALLADTRASLLAMKPAYQRVIAWGQSELPTAPSGRVGAVSLPGGLDYYAAALRLNTTLDITADQIHAIGLKEVARIEGEQDALARKAGFADRNAFYADRARRFPPQPWTDALRADYLARANATLAHNRSLLPARFYKLPSTGSKSFASLRSAKLPAGPRTPHSPTPTAPGPAACSSTCSATPAIPPRSPTSCVTRAFRGT